MVHLGHRRPQALRTTPAVASRAFADRVRSISRRWFVQPAQMTEEQQAVTDPKKLAWIAICGGIGAVFAAAIAEVLSGSLAVAIACDVFGGALTAVIGFYVD
jgi:hypothetical protein